MESSPSDLVPKRRLHESLEQRVGSARARIELRVKLRGQKPGVLLKFDDLDEATVRRERAAKGAV
jgi:hypothetical protein